VSALRGTGRTTRMLEQAKAAAREGGRVLVVCETRAHAEQVRRQLGSVPNVIVRCVAEGPLRGQRLTTFVDHYVYEQMAARFDFDWGVAAVKEETT
jgi:hypothetical protein